LLVLGDAFREIKKQTLEQPGMEVNSLQRVDGKLSSAPKTSVFVFRSLSVANRDAGIPDVPLTVVLKDDGGVAGTRYRVLPEATVG